MERSLHLVLHGELSQVTSCDTKLLFSTEKKHKGESNVLSYTEPAPITFLNRKKHTCGSNFVSQESSLFCRKFTLSTFVEAELVHKGRDANVDADRPVKSSTHRGVFGLVVKLNSRNFI
jgi:hypothetical protein